MENKPCCMYLCKVRNARASVTGAVVLLVGHAAVNFVRSQHSSAMT